MIGGVRTSEACSLYGWKGSHDRGKDSHDDRKGSHEMGKGSHGDGMIRTRF